MGKSKSKGKSKSATPGHYTESGTRKFQANGPIAWGPTFRKAAGKGREGEGIRLAMAYAIAHEGPFLAWAAKQEDGHVSGPKQPKGKGKGKPAAGGFKASKPARKPKQLALPKTEGEAK